MSNYCRTFKFPLRSKWKKIKIPLCRGSFSVLHLRLTFLQGLEETSKEALKARLCWVVRMVRGLLGLLGSFPSSPLPWLPIPFSGLMSSSSSSLFSAGKKMKCIVLPKWTQIWTKYRLYVVDRRLINVYFYSTTSGEEQTANQTRHVFLAFYQFLTKGEQKKAWLDFQKHVESTLKNDHGVISNLLLSALPNLN